MFDRQLSDLAGALMAAHRCEICQMSEWWVIGVICGEPTALCWECAP